MLKRYVEFKKILLIINVGLHVSIAEDVAIGVFPIIHLFLLIRIIRTTAGGQVKING